MIHTYTKDGKTIKYQVIIKNNKHTYFHFKPELLVITKNKNVPMERILNIIENEFDKFYQKLNKRIKLNSDEILLFGKILSLTIIDNSKFNYEISENKIILYKPLKLSLDEAINKLYKQVLTNKILELEPTVEMQIRKLNLELVKFKLKDVKSYYGKCFINKKEIIYSLKLAKLDSIFLEYVIYHEYSHFIEANHSKKFYQVLEKLMPNYYEVQKKLKKVKV